MLFEKIFVYGILFSIAKEDYRNLRIPNVQLFILFCLSFLMDLKNEKEVILKIVSGIFYAIMFLVIKIASKGLGTGDVKLAGVFGYEFGFFKSAVSFSIASILGIVFIRLKRMKNDSKQIKQPFAPNLLIGAFLSDILFYIFTGNKVYE